jgi:hypothetical protein
MHPGTISATPFVPQRTRFILSQFITHKRRSEELNCGLRARHSRFSISLFKGVAGLRASNEYLPSVRVLRARRMVWPLSSRPAKLARLPLQRVG